MPTFCVFHGKDDEQCTIIYKQLHVCMFLKPYIFFLI